MSYRTADRCRACQSTNLQPVVDLGNQPLANNFVKPGEPRQGFYPLKINYCGECGLAQLSVVVDRDMLYRHYAYTSSSSQTMQRHYDRLFKDIESEVSLKCLVEVGSNNGGLLKFAKARGWDCIGIDPAKNLCDIARAEGVTCFDEYFSVQAAKNIREWAPAIGVVLARHVFAHIDDWGEFIAALEIVAAKDSLVCIEVPYAADMLRRVEFDTTYHEHLSYITLKPIVKLLQRSPFHIHRINHYGVHGGVLLLMLRTNDSGITPHLSAEEMVLEENIGQEDWAAFAANTARKISRLQAIVAELWSQNKIVSGFGASAKMTVLLNACGFSRKEIAFVTDNSPLKPGNLVPGTDIPVIEEGEMLSQHPDVAICGAWNFRAEVLEKMARYRERKGRFVFPLGSDWEIV
jgi:novobiocin biosynthesis protein NovU/D-mycarose 3-C-methyltransferase